jgi:hypothetical protein
MTHNIKLFIDNVKVVDQVVEFCEDAETVKKAPKRKEARKEVVPQLEMQEAPVVLQKPEVPRYDVRSSKLNFIQAKEANEGCIYWNVHGTKLLIASKDFTHNRVYYKTPGSRKRKNLQCIPTDYQLFLTDPNE